MDAGRIVNMIIHQVVRRLIGHGVDAGINRLSRGKNGEDTMDPGMRRQQKQMQRSMKIGRRVGRF